MSDSESETEVEKIVKNGKKKPRTQCRGWCYTINNPTDEDMIEVGTLITDSEADYFINAEEVGEEGTPHYQGYVRFKTKKSLKYVKTCLTRAHLEMQKGTYIDAILYCMKDGCYIEQGDRPVQGKRSDLEVIYKDIKKGVSDKEIAIKYPTQYAFHRRSFTAFREMNSVKHTTVYAYDPEDEDHGLIVGKLIRQGAKDFEDAYTATNIYKELGKHCVDTICIGFHNYKSAKLYCGAAYQNTRTKQVYYKVKRLCTPKNKLSFKCIEDAFSKEETGFPEEIYEEERADSEEFGSICEKD